MTLVAEDSPDMLAFAAICVSVQESVLAKENGFQIGADAGLLDVNVVKSAVAVYEAMLHQRL